jgi:hypothetical protein
MPLLALKARLAPPTRSVAVTALLYGVTSRTLVLLLALHPLGSVAVALVPRDEKFSETVPPGAIETCPSAEAAKSVGSITAQSGAKKWERDLLFMGVES